MESVAINSELFGKSLQSRKVAAFSLSERFYAPHFKTPEHSHDNALFCLVLKGNYTETFGRAHRECSPRTALFHASGDPHAEHFHDAGGHSFIVEIERTWMAKIRDEFGFPSITSDFRRGVLPILGAKLYREFRRFDEVSPLIVEGLMLEIAGETARRTFEKKSRKPDWLVTVESYLRERLAEPFSLNAVAAVAGVHPVHLAQTFRKFHHSSVGAYLMRLRLDSARRELTETKKTIAEIALSHGFSDQSHFTRRFKSELGATPHEYRKITS